MLDIDGSFGEGGGQILHSALALSLLTGKPFRLRKIRANRKPKPGLQPQHLAVRAAAAVGSAAVTGDAVGSSAITFEPGAVTPGRYHCPIGTAGSTSLVLHTVYLPLMWRTTGPSEVAIEGGTHNDAAPCFHFLDSTWRIYLERRSGVRGGPLGGHAGEVDRGRGDTITPLTPNVEGAPSNFSLLPMGRPSVG